MSGSSHETGVSDPADLLRGRGRFLADLPATDALHVAFVRSPHACGRLTHLDLAGARTMPGVVAVLGAEHLSPAMPALNRFDHQPTPPPRRPIAGDRIDWPGQALALVLATSAGQARDAADAVAFEIQPDDHDPREPIMQWRLRQGEVVRRGQQGGSADAGPGPAAAREIWVEADITQPRVAALALETRGLLARIDDGGRLEVWAPTQSPARARDEIATALGIAADRVRVRVADVGGAFGSKASLGPDELLVAAAAWREQRTLRWIATRSEEFVAGVHGRGGRLQGRLSCGPDGRLRHLDAELTFPVGGWLPYSALVPARNATRILPGPYRLRGSDVRTQVLGEARAAVNIYRGAGRPEAAMLMEWLLDDAARALGHDPLALREANLIGAADMPWPLPGGDHLEGGDPRALLARAAQLFGYERECQARKARRLAGEHVGIGIGCYVEPCGQGFERARLSIDADGRVLLALGTASQGQGHARPFAILVAEVLGCDPARVSVLEGDTALCPDGIGALASRSMAIGGSAAHLAALAVRKRLDRGETPPLAETVRYHAPAEAFGLGAVIVRLSMAPDTFEPTIERLVWVDDCGRVIDDHGLKAQQIGAMAQGIGQALSEALHYDEQGQLLSGSLLDYALPRADAMPLAVELHTLPSACKVNAIGARGIGEAGCIGVPAAIINAARDALAQGRPLPGDLALDPPLTAEKLWRAAGRLARVRQANG
ncbi:MAG: xanthine dehydrogenase family protein molybdopterin-binding subunit [Burkholderiaceae bacterium]